MTGKTIQLIITIIGFATEVMAAIKEKISGRKYDDKGASKEK